MPAHMGDTQRSKPSLSGQFETLKAGEGALITTRSNHAQAAEAALGKRGDAPRASRRLSGAHKPHVERKGPVIKTDKRVVAALVVGALVVVALMGSLFLRALKSTRTDEAPTSILEQAVVEPAQSVNYGGYDYALSKSDSGSYILTRSAAGSAEPLELMELDGSPVALMLYKGAFLIPENFENSWDVMAYTVGDGSVPTRLADSTGADFVGSGTLVSARIEDNRLVLVDSQSRTSTTPLD